MYNNSRLIQIKDHANLSKDKFSGSIINTDVEGFQAFKRKKAEKAALQKTISEQNDKINTLQQELNLIKEILGIKNG